MSSLRITPNNQNNKGGSQATGIVLLSFSAVILLCLLTNTVIFGGFGAFIKNFFEGLFGVTAYALALGGILAGYLLMAKRSISVPKRYIRATIWLFLSFVLIIHFSTTSGLLYAANDWGDYIMKCYDVQNNILSGGGVIAAVIIYPVGKLTGLVGTYILLCVVTLVCFMVITNFAILKVLSSARPNKQNKPRAGKREKSTAPPKISVRKPRTANTDSDIPTFWVKKTPVATPVSNFSEPTKEDRPIVKEVYEGDKYFTPAKSYEPEYKEPEKPKKSKLYNSADLDQLLRPKNYNDTYTKNFEQNAGHKSLFDKFSSKENIEEIPREPRREVPPTSQVRRPTIVIHNPSESGVTAQQSFPDYSLATPQSIVEKPVEKLTPEHVEFFPHKIKPDPNQEPIVDGEKWSKQKAEQQVEKPRPEPKTNTLKPIELLKPPVTDEPRQAREELQDEPQGAQDAQNPAQPKTEPKIDAEYEPPQKLSENLSDIINNASHEEQEKAREEAINILKPKADKSKNEQIGIRIPETSAKEPTIGTPKVKHSRYKAPSIDLLRHAIPRDKDDHEDYEENRVLLENTLAEFKIAAKVTNVVCGPTVTRYELEMAPGIPVRKVVSVADDIAMRLSAVGGIRIEAPIPGKNLFGVEVPNLNTETVSLRSIIESRAFKSKDSGLFFALGKDIGGADVVQDLADMPHLLIAGATGQGKSVCLNSLIISLLYKYSPEELRLILVDPKTVEFGIYNEMPHLMLKEVVTTPESAINAFSWLIKEMERRYTFFHATGALNINAYNAMMEGTEYSKLPRIVLVADELADLMLNHKSEIEPKILKLAAKARAAGIHLVLATQRPSVDVITGTIKTNLPYRIALRVTSLVDSRTILDQGGSEKLIGKGDMLLKTATLPEPVRLQGAYVSSDEVRAVVDYLKSNNECHFDKSVEDKIMKTNSGMDGGDDGDSDRDKLFVEALKYCIDAKSASIAMIQRRFGVGYARAGKIVEDMERLGFISGFEGSRARQILITAEEFDQRYGGDD